MSALQFPPSVHEDWHRYERRSARRRLKSARSTSPAAVWINRPALQGGARPRALVVLLLVSGLVGALWASS